MAQLYTAIKIIKPSSNSNTTKCQQPTTCGRSEVTTCPNKQQSEIVDALKTSFSALQNMISLFQLGNR